jgi:NAD(P)-dependent dehydrogenase (short-subunit alcohol dehydrogenase family)
MRLKDKVAIVSGAASGMGQCEAMLFAREGAKVIVADVLETEGRQTADKITAGGGQAKFVKLDVTSEANWQSTVEAAVSATASSTSSSTTPASVARSIPTC